MPTKSSTVKAAPKKAAPKKRVHVQSATTKKPKARNTLVVASPETCFWLHDGQILDSLPALAKALSTMETSLYAYHVNKGTNDFAEWVEHVLNDLACAKALRGKRTPKTAHTVVITHLKRYQR